MVPGKINRGRYHPAGRHSIRTNQRPPPPPCNTITLINYTTQRAPK